MTGDTALVGTAVMAAATGISVAASPVAGALARRAGVIDHPGHRKVHASPTPRTGGIAVYLAFMAVVGAGYFLAPQVARIPALRELAPLVARVLLDVDKVTLPLAALLAGGTISFAVGLADDVWGTRFPVALKAGGLAVAAAIAIAGGVKVSFLPWEPLNVALTLAWLFGITNAFNLIDNMDGLAGGVAFVASLVLLINALLMGGVFISLLLLAFMGALAGFLVFNLRGLLFLGDCGSLFVGFVMGAITLLERYVSHASSTLFPVLMPVLVLAVPILDTATVVVIRMREGRPIYVGDKRHLSHRLVDLGLTRRLAVGVLCLLTFALGLGAASLTHATVVQAVLVLFQAAGFVAVILVVMFRERPPAAGPSA